MAVQSRTLQPKTLSQARATYNTSGELAWWIFMRVSGLLLVFLVFGHLYMNNMLINVADVDYNYVASRFSKAWVKVYDTFILFFAMLHGVNGLRYSIEDYFRNPKTRFFAKTTLFFVASVVFILGTVTLWAFTYQEMGDAVRDLGKH